MGKFIIYWYIICTFAPTLFCILLNILPTPTVTTSCHLISHEVAPTVYNDPDKRSGLIEPSSVGRSAPTQVQRLSQCVCSALPQLSVFCHFLTLRGKLRFIWCVWYSDNDTGKKKQTKNTCFMVIRSNCALTCTFPLNNVNRLTDFLGADSFIALERIIKFVMNYTVQTQL